MRQLLLLLSGCLDARAMRLSATTTVPVFVCLALGLAGCGNSWACGDRSGSQGCFCTSEELNTTEVTTCSAADFGAPTCCDDLTDDICSCPPAPRCWMDGEACLCGTTPPAGVTPVGSCTAPPGLICCASTSLPLCVCGLAECLLPDDRQVAACSVADVEVCRSDEQEVPDCAAARD